MICLNCANEDVTVFFIENVPCSHCGEDNEISYNACQHCGLMWKSCDGKLLDGALFTDPNVDVALGDTADFIRAAEIPTSMEEIVHKCLRCGTISFEIDPNYYHCPKCEFEWEII